MSFCADCFKAVVHEGTPKGEMVEIGGVQCYVAMPNVEYPKDKVVLFLTDACGLGLPNNKLLADDFARNGFKTIVPDLFSGDAVPESAFEPDAPPFDWQKWVTRHGAAETRPLLDAMVAALQDQHGVVAMAGTGYCFGGRYVFDLALEGIITVAAVAHPSLLKAPDDFEKYLATATAPLLINSCTIDQAFPPEMQAQADTILGDMNDPKVKAGKEGAFKATVDWFLEYL
ncbi:Alpha/Beta hydrolase protein [Mycena rosella]|uniref:Alpha/Beta hydrolase protein n=1 Tax=Mycena rosella TaxID=1033263 RepID=A0AAD7GZ99_MYCRO|nr:Alpha/Beta hydrolase protein [Mycena rosella]